MSPLVCSAAAAAPKDRGGGVEGCHVCGRGGAGPLMASGGDQQTLSSSSSLSSLRRCSRCHGPERYCSVDCQRYDWRHGSHQRQCRQRQQQQQQQQVQSATAWKELSALMSHASLRDLTHDYHRAKDQVGVVAQQQQQQQQEKQTPEQQLQQQQQNQWKEKEEQRPSPRKSNRKEPDWLPTTVRHNPNRQIPTAAAAAATRPTTVNGGNSTKLPLTSPSLSPLSPATPRQPHQQQPPRQRQPPRPQLGCWFWKDWHIQVSHLSHLSCFSIQLQATTTTTTTTTHRAGVLLSSNHRKDWTRFFSVAMTTHGVGGNVPHATRRTTPVATSQRIGLYFHEHEWTTTTTTATKSPNPPPPPQPVNDPNQKPVVVAGDKTKEETTSRCSHGSPNEDLIGPEQYEDDDSSRVLLVTFDLPVTTTRITTTTTTPWYLCSLNQVTVAVADADTTLTASTTTTSSSYQNTLYSTNTITGSPTNAVQKGKDEDDGNAPPPLPPTGTCTWFWNVRVRYNQEEEEDDMRNTTTAASPQSRRPWSHANQVNNNKNDKNDSCRLHQALKYHPESVTCRMCRMMGVHEEQDDDRPEVLEATESALGESQRLVYEWTNTATSLFASSSSSSSSQTAATTTETTKRTNDDDDDGQQTAPFSITTTTTTHAVDATTRTTTTGFDLYQLPTGHWQDMAEYLSCGGGGDEVNSHHFFWPTTASPLHENVQNTNNNNNNKNDDDDDDHHHHHDYRHRIGWNAGYLVVGAAASAALVNPQACFPLLYHDDESSWFAHSTTATTTATTTTTTATWYPSILSSVSFLTTTWHPLACSRCCSILGFCSLPSTTRNTSSAPFPSSSSSSSSSLTRVDEDAATDTSLGDADAGAGADHGPEKDRSRIDGSFLDGTVYLLRHALSSSSSATCANPTTAAAAVDCSPLQFWIQELIHLAETKGIFTMVLRKNHHNNNNTTTTNGKDSSSSATTTTTTTATDSCLWIRLGHWNSQEASNRVHKNNHKQQQRPNTTTTIESFHQPLKWYRVAKVVYQFLDNGNELSSSNDQNQQEEEEAATALSTTEESPLSFPWTRNGNHNRSNGNDWCCRPTTEAAATSTTNPSRDTDPVANAPPLALEAVVWNDWEWESMQHDLRQQWNVLFVCEATTTHLTPTTTTFSTTQRMAQTTYWAQTGQRLTDVQCTTRSAGVAHVPLDYWG